MEAHLNIPHCFNHLNAALMYGNMDGARGGYAYRMPDQSTD